MASREFVDILRNQFAYKLKIVFLPFLLTSASAIIAYTLLVLLFFMKDGIALFPESYGQYWIPLILASILVFLFVHPSIKILRLRENLPWFYYLVATFSIVIPAMTAQRYLVAVTGTTVHLPSIREMATHPVDKFFTFERFCAYRPHSSAAVQETPGVKNPYELNISYFIVCPILETDSDTVLHSYTAWLGYKFKTQLNTHDDDSVTQRQYESFLDSSVSSYNGMDLNDFIFLERCPNSDDRPGYVYAVGNNLRRHNTEPPIVLIAHHEPFASRGNFYLGWTFGSYGIAMLLWFIMSVGADTRPVRIRRYLRRKERFDSEALSDLSVFIPRKGFFVTPILLIALALTFAVMVISGLGFVNFKSEDLIKWGGNYNPLLREGQWWRLVSAMFLHGGVMHLLNNLYGLFMAGMFLEPLIGRARFVTVYVVGGIAAGVTSTVYHQGEVCIGASGAIFGLFGTLLAIIFSKNLQFRPGLGFAIHLAGFVGLNILLGFLTPWVDNAAHVGGLVTGLILGFAILPSLNRENI